MKKNHILNIEITKKNIDTFIKLSGDSNKLHQSSSFAIKKGFESAVVHGAYQIALTSQSIGKWLIGSNCLISSFKSNFILPLYYPQKIKIYSEIINHNKNVNLLEIKTDILNEENKIVSEIFSNVKILKKNFFIAKEKYTPLRKVKKSINKKQKTLIITGASSHLMKEIIAKLSNKYNLILILKNSLSIKKLKKNILNKSRFVICDLINNSHLLLNKLRKVINKNEKIWGIIHAAHIAFNSKKIFDQISEYDFSCVYNLSIKTPYYLAKFLKQNSNKKQGRFITIGSNFSLESSPRRNYLLYGYSKTILNNTTKALSSYLASSGITFNIISPDIMFLGMNKMLDQSFINLEISNNPQKRLCDSNDVCETILFILDKKNQFISGQDIKINGGKI